MEEILFVIWIISTIISVVGLIFRCEAAVLIMIFAYITTWIYMGINK